MKRVLVWDLPVRAFHLVFILTFLAAFWIAKVLGEHRPLFPWHVAFGLTMGFAVVLRLAWGAFGSRTARLRALFHSPGAVARYFGGALTGKGDRHAGHNPGSSLVIVGMILSAATLVTTGALVAVGQGRLKEVHELASYAMLGLIGVHLLGVLLHTVRFREMIAISMLDGRREVPEDQAIPSARPGAGLVFVVLVALFAVAIFRSYDGALGAYRLPVLGDVFVGEPMVGSEEHGEGREDRD